MPDTARPEADGNPLAVLRKQLIAACDVSQLKTICFDLGVDDEDLGTDKLSDMARELISHFARKRRLPELLSYLARERPEINWPSLESQEPTVTNSSCCQQIRHELEDFYRPIYKGLLLDRRLWRAILGIRAERGSSEHNLALHCETEVILPNHAQIAQVIDDHSHAVNLDPNLASLLDEYREAAQDYIDLRATGNTERFSLTRLGDDWWHQKLFDTLKARLDELEDEYARTCSSTAQR
jgi:hypothetical protein